MRARIPVDAMTPSILPDTAHQLTRLLYALADGERVATDCASWQARVTADPRSRRFFRAQARQERFHATLFQGAAHWLAPKVSASDSPSIGLERYRKRLASAMSRGRWIEVLVGQQIVLEKLGQGVLARLDAEIDRRGLGFGRLRRTVLRQEQAHHAFGSRSIDAELQAQRTNPTELRALAESYIGLADAILVEVSPLLESLDADAAEYRDELRRHLPYWAVRSNP